MPAEALYLWRWFCELERTRQMGQHAMQPLAYAEIMAWATLTGRRPRPHEVDALLDLDIATRAASLDDA